MFLETAYKLVKHAYIPAPPPLYIPKIHKSVNPRPGKIIITKKVFQAFETEFNLQEHHSSKFILKIFIAKLFFTEKWLWHVQETAVNVIHLPASGNSIRAHDMWKMKETSLNSKELHNTYYTIQCSMLAPPEQNQDYVQQVLASVALCIILELFHNIRTQNLLFFVRESLQLYSSWGQSEVLRVLMHYKI